MKYNIRLDICTLCKLNCPTCTMRMLNYGKLKAGYITFEKYKEFIDNNKNLIKRIEISNAGEPFLNPDVIDILRYSYENNIDITCNNATTLNFDNKKVLEAIVNYQIKELVVAIDGVDQEHYEKYRRNGNIDLVFNNLKYLLNYKKLKNSEFPKIKWQYVIMENTEDKDQIIRAKEIASELGIEIFFKLTWDGNYKPNNVDELKELTGLNSLTRTEFKTNTGSNYKIESKCRQLWSFPQINWDGQLLGCCFNREPFNVNVFDLGLKKAFESEQFKKAKLWLTNRYDNDNSTPCMNCIYGNLVVSEGGMDMEFVNHQENLTYKE